MKTKDDILLENAYEKIIERNEDIENEQESLFNRYEQEFDTFLDDQCETVDHDSLDYDIDESGELFFYMPTIRFSSDVNIDRDLDIDSQVDRARNMILNFIDKNPTLKNVIDMDEISVEHSADKHIGIETVATENEWIGVNIYTKENIEIKEEGFQNFLKMVKFVDSFLTNLTTFPQFKRL